VNLERIARLRQLGISGVASKLAARSRRAARHSLLRRRDSSRPSFVTVASGERPVRRLQAVPSGGSPAPEAIEAILQHRFDLLGSGPVIVTYGMRCPGLHGHWYPPGAAVVPDLAGNWLAAHVSPANLGPAQALWRQVSPGYQPIDWQIDARSGFRWSARCWSVDLPPAPKSADVKQPWELARLQHLPLLSLAYRHAPDPRLPREFQDQVLDFLSANPPRFGVNWVCAMEVAIRVANLLLAWDLFAVQQVVFDPGFEAELAAAIRAHGRFIFANLEWQPDYRGNHYLANLIGLLFCAAYLSEDAETTRWSDFSARELSAETATQFLPDGGSHEASTCYHLLAAELVAFGTALLLGMGHPVTAAHAGRLDGMARFARDVTAPDGRLPQVGDNDNGRLFKLSALDDAEASRIPDDVAGAIAALFGATRPGPGNAIAAQLAARRTLPTPATRPQGTLPRAPINLPRTGCRRRRFEAAAAGSTPSCWLYGHFGLAVFAADWLFAAVRCRTEPLVGPGSHAHNDQLALELWLDGRPLIRDPGSYLYTPAPDWRDRYRSIGAHDAPWLEGLGEPGRFRGVFGLANGPLVDVLHVGPDGFLARLRPPAAPIHRGLRIGAGWVEVIDWVEGDPTPRWLPLQPEAYSPGYGRREGPPTVAIACAS
jgi:hypothetical protein